MANPPTPANVKLLCHFDGVNGQTTATDSSSFSRILTASGGIALTTAVSKFGGSSSVSAQTGAKYWSCTDSEDWHFGSGQFTVEGWVYFTAAPSSVHALVAQWTTNNNLGFFFGHVSGALAFYYSTTGTDNPNVGAPWTPVLNTWYHIAADRDSSNVLRVYLNGAVYASATVSSTFFNSSAQLDIGGNVTWYGPEGAVDDVRVTKNEAVYGGAFTVPNTAFPDPVIAPTNARVSQLPVEVLRTNTGIKAQTSQLPVEVLRLNLAPSVGLSQFTLEVLRPNAGVYVPSGRRPSFICT